MRLKQSRVGNQLQLEVQVLLIGHKRAAQIGCDNGGSLDHNDALQLFHPRISYLKQCIIDGAAELGLEAVAKLSRTLRLDY